MPNSRRSRLVAWGAAAALALPLALTTMPAAAATPADPENGPYWAVPPEQIGVVGYTLRTQIGEDPLATLTATKNCGIVNYEFSGSVAALQGKPPAELKAVADQLDLNVPSLGVSEADLRDRVEEVRTTANLFGAKIVRISGNGNEPAVFERIAEVMNTAGQALASDGIRVLYHNHGEVFPVLSNGKTGMQILAENTNPEWVGFELDLFWAVNAGADPIEVIKQYPGRILAFHVKDRKDGTFATVGQGEIDFQSIFAYRELAGVEWYFIENDQPQPDGITSACESYAYLTTSPAVDDGAIPLNVQVVAPETGALVLTIADFGAGVALGEARNLGNRLAYEAALPQVSVTDTRPTDQRAWSVSGQAADFAAGENTIAASHLGWRPSLGEVAERVTAGHTVLGELDGGTGLRIPATLASAGADAGAGTSLLGATLDLQIPTETAPGDYQGTLTISLFAED